MAYQEVEKYSKPVRVLHWFNTASFLLLFITGLILFIPPLAIAAQDSWTRLIHRIAAVLLVAAPVIFALIYPGKAARALKEAFTWGSGDLDWLKAAPAYYFLADESAMPPQGHMNTGQKMWWFLTVVFGVVFVATGAVMWFARDTIAPTGFLWAIFTHDVAFIVTGAMLFVHLYLSVAHPLMRPLRTGSWSAMTRGTVSAEYARAHHARWFEEITAATHAQAAAANREKVLVGSHGGKTG
ncbi:MAG: cytochrome b/b6 domain-containing protein [Chloroflexi bacterium]|nr:cytochrome b/b6 domain-containing protein [Chloroflexota bacterium]